MVFRIDCDCGIPLKVSEASAGGSVQCLCGRTVPVPQLTELRVRAGLPPYHIGPELLIEHLLLRGELPPTRACVECGNDTGDRVYVCAVCERARVRQSGGISWAVLLFGFLLFRALIRIWEERETTVLGKDKIYRLPLPVCAACRPRLRGPHVVREWLGRVAVYEQLLDKFPDADLNLE
jgi:hypothetical protein